ncbi:CRISPR-associated helicase Cas3' [Streptomyces sp. NPDC090741]|uniref:CRISPR-associated helicase Cas3' n=1 Tax=Streptomyces sp. NPDC090741 TaxID=3365967 RepID=UPI00380C4E08
MRLDPRLWGKDRGLDRPYPVGCHGVDTAAIMEVLWERYLNGRQRVMLAAGWGMSESETRQLLVCLGFLHDLAKISPVFQRQAADADVLSGTPEFPATGESTPYHDHGVHLALPELLHRVYGLPLDGRPSRLVAEQLGQILGGHHGRYGELLSHQDGSLTCPIVAAPGLGEQGWDEQREAMVRLAGELFGVPVWPTRRASAPVAAVTTGLVSLADWLASQSWWLKARQRQHRTTRWVAGDWDGHLRMARRAGARVLARAQLLPPDWQRARTFGEMFPGLAGVDPYPLQASIEREFPALVDGPGMLLVTAAPGDGKTEIALFAERVLGRSAGTRGLVMLLPTMATTDAMHRRLVRHAGHNCRGKAPVARLHSLAWLDAEYTPEDLTPSLEHPALVSDWLRGPHRGLLTGIAVGTWDQAVRAVLPHKYMAMRWLGLSGKTVIIDEAHAYDAHGHALTVTLLEWLGQLGVPVVVLSATLTGTIATSLLNAYRRGAGHTPLETVAPAYPGWTYTDHATGATSIGGPYSSPRAHRLDIRTHPYTPSQGSAGSIERTRLILDILDPLHTGSETPGAALIVCNTVADAQATEGALRDAYKGSRTLVRILHARMPVHQRHGVTRRLERWTGPVCPAHRTADGTWTAATGERPGWPVVVITTQVAEQSLDVDFDVVITDLAPFALLAQRAGRGHRHQGRTRPPYAEHPTLHVLTPVTRKGQPTVPRHWGQVYDASLLRRTHEHLATLTGPIAIPEELQHHVDAVYSDTYTAADDVRRGADENAKQALADLVALRTHRTGTNLHPLTNSTYSSELLTTRLGDPSIRVLPVWTDPDGRHWLHPTQRTARTSLPRRVRPGDRRTIRRLMRRTIPIRRQWIATPAGDSLINDPDTTIPVGWEKTPALRDIALLPQSAVTGAYTNGTNVTTSDVLLGLVRTRTR